MRRPRTGLAFRTGRRRPRRRTAADAREGDPGRQQRQRGRRSSPAPANKKQRAAWSAEAIVLGYETGTIKNSAYVLLAQSGVQGMTVATIVDAATKQGLYSWGTCKTPNNSVTAALSQDTTFVRIAPRRTRCGRRRAAVGPVPQARTSSGSINSGQPAQRSMSGSGLSAGAVAGGRSNLGPKAISSKARGGTPTRARPEWERREPGEDGDGGREGPPSDAHVLDGGPRRRGPVRRWVRGVGRHDGRRHALARRHAHGRRGRGRGGCAARARRAPDARGDELGTPRRSPPRRDGELPAAHGRVRGTMHGEYEHDRGVPVHPAGSAAGIRDGGGHRGRACRGFPWRTSRIPAEQASPMREPTEGIMRASSWKGRGEVAVRVAGPEGLRGGDGVEPPRVRHLPKWVLESFNSGMSPRRNRRGSRGI